MTETESQTTQARIRKIRSLKLKHMLRITAIDIKWNENAAGYEVTAHFSSKLHGVYINPQTASARTINNALEFLFGHVWTRFGDLGYYQQTGRPRPEM